MYKIRFMCIIIQHYLSAVKHFFIFRIFFRYINVFALSKQNKNVQKAKQSEKKTYFMNTSDFFYLNLRLRAASDFFLRFTLGFS